ncbi:XapX domain-containing protein [Pseudoduganella lurida]|uniref:XapX domain-containing protein n=1 Tax=Pseudoduganella lurida TaxID=1036180 RepID=A0A562R5B6_9BURK|nr:XapX domain-containing protein [Pseudoduganella lurida]TWI64255.1 XapX domain-containing protein [Pseudoduganella lurida]
MTALVIGAVLGLALGAICRACDIPSPAPPTPIGALLVVAMTSGYVVGGMF